MVTEDGARLIETSFAVVGSGWCLYDCDRGRREANIVVDTS